jgi:hypothetical protein
MKFNLSTHAQQEMERRNISRALLESILNSPQQIVPVMSGMKAYQSKIDFGGKIYLVRAIVNEDAFPPIVLTVYRTSKIEKYWRKS